MKKNAVLYEEAKRLYVYDGLSIDAIVEILKNNVSRKTLYNWKNDYNWDVQRKKYLQQTEDLHTELLEIAKNAIKKARANPTPHNIYAVAKAISCLKLMQGIELKDDSDEPKSIKPETIEFIQKTILGID
ncbi:MAG: DUF1804 family protein [Ignavibacteria bacterium]|nr:DUF1804 family protein [Ignavibacteria bacterium]